jgi:hypothetical protein
MTGFFSSEPDPDGLREQLVFPSMGSGGSEG